MFLWFVIVAPVIVAEVFRSPMADYRLVALGALVPFVDLVFGRPAYLHTTLVSVAVLAAVMLGTRGSRLLRRQLLGIPIGMLLRLVLDGTWTDQRLMWWPAFGFGFEERRLPAFERPIVGLGLEVMAVGIGIWAYRRYELGSPENQARLLKTGQLPRSALQD